MGGPTKKLRDEGFDNNTIVAFTTDNGAENFTWPRFSGTASRDEGPDRQHRFDPVFRSRADVQLARLQHLEARRARLHARACGGTRQRRGAGQRHRPRARAITIGPPGWVADAYGHAAHAQAPANFIAGAGDDRLRSLKSAGDDLALGEDITRRGGEATVAPPPARNFSSIKSVDTHKQETSLWASASISSVKTFVKSSP
jgi:hypothetical protein